MKKLIAMVFVLVLALVLVNTAFASVQVSNMGDVRTYMAVGIPLKNPAIVDDKAVYEAWLPYHYDLVINAPVQAYQDWTQHGGYGYTPVEDGKLLPYQVGSVIVVNPDLYKKIRLTSLDDVTLLHCPLWGREHLDAKIVDDGHGRTVMIETDWIVSDGFKAITENGEHEAGVVVGRGMATIYQISDLGAGGGGCNTGFGWLGLLAPLAIVKKRK